MFSNITLTKNVIIHPCNITKKLHFYINDYLNRTYLDTLSVHGYIKSIQEIVSIYDGEMTANSNGSIMYKVDFNAEIYQLKEKQNVKCIVNKITTFGIYCRDIDDPNNVSTLFVPKLKIDKESFNKYKENDIINLQIDGLRINHNEYLGVCEII